MNAMPSHRDQRTAGTRTCECVETVQHNDLLQVVVPSKRGRGYTLVTEYTVECAACGYTLYVVRGDAWPTVRTPS